MSHHSSIADHSLDETPDYYCSKFLGCPELVRLREEVEAKTKEADNNFLALKMLIRVCEDNGLDYASALGISKPKSKSVKEMTREELKAENKEVSKRQIGLHCGSQEAAPMPTAEEELELAKERGNETIKSFLHVLAMIGVEMGVEKAVGIKDEA